MKYKLLHDHPLAIEALQNMMRRLADGERDNQRVFALRLIAEADVRDLKFYLTALSAMTAYVVVLLDSPDVTLCFGVSIAFAGDDLDELLLVSQLVDDLPEIVKVHMAEFV